MQSTLYCRKSESLQYYFNLYLNNWNFKLTLKNCAFQTQWELLMERLYVHNAFYTYRTNFWYCVRQATIIFELYHTHKSSRDSTLSLLLQLPLPCPGLLFNTGKSFIIASGGKYFQPGLL